MARTVGRGRIQARRLVEMELSSLWLRKMSEPDQTKKNKAAGEQLVAALSDQELIMYALYEVLLHVE